MSISSRIFCLRTALSLFSLACICGFSGCSSEEKRFHISGSVKYKGKPVPFGYITFEPDTSKGASGGPGRTQILDGKYDTRNAESVGTIGGPHVVNITGFDSKISGAGEGSKEVSLPKSLFTDYRVSEDLPTQDTTKDFDISK